MADPITLEDVKRLRLQPGDTLVLRSDRRLNIEQVKMITAQMKAAFPGHRIAVLDEHLSLEVVEPDKAAFDEKRD